MISDSEVSFCVDTLLVETVLADPKFYKKAGFVSDMLTSVQEYFSAHIDKSNPVASVIDVLAPGALWLLFQSLGLGKFGLLLGLLTEVFHVDAYGMLKSLFGKVRSMLSSGEKVSSAQVDSAVQESAQEFAKPATQEEAQKGYQRLQEHQSGQSSSWADDGAVYSSLELMHDAKIISLALISYEDQRMRLTKEGAPKFDPSSFFSGFGSTKAKGTSLLARIFGWVIKIALASAGLMVAGDVVNKVIGRPNAFDKTYQAGKETAPEAKVNVPVGPVSKQTKFKLKSDAPLPSSWPLTNTPSNIENMLIQFTKDVYDGLDGKESIIQSSAAFQAIREEIEWYNVHNPGSAVIFIPSNFTSKKQLVDYFIDDVAKRAG